jgi:hypothetical protein
MDPQEIVQFSSQTIFYLELDRRTFEYVMKHRGDVTPGGLGFAMITTAMAAFDVYAYLLKQRFNSPPHGNARIFQDLLRDHRFFDESKYISAETFYATIRCGVMHQLYPKGSSIVAFDTPQILFEHFNKISVNAYALYCDVLTGIKKIHAYFESLSDVEKLDYVIKLRIREKADAEQSNATVAQIAALPNLTTFQAQQISAANPTPTQARPTP